MLRLRIAALVASTAIGLCSSCRPTYEAAGGKPSPAAGSSSRARSGGGGQGSGARPVRPLQDAGEPSDVADASPSDAATSVRTAANGGSAGRVATDAGVATGDLTTPGSSAGASGQAAVGGQGGAAVGSSGVDSSASAELFDEGTVVRFDITLPESSVAALGSASDVYTHGGLSYRDTTLGDVGVRIKGESSRRTLMQKAAFKLKLDEYVAGQTLLGMKRITLNNMLSDDTYMAECLAYHVWRAASLPAPRCNHAVVYVNGVYYGLYAHVESEDKAFLRRWFPSDDGNLYEDGMADFVDGAASSFDLETNETENNRADLIALISAVSSAGGASYLQDLDPVLDTSHFLRYSAMEAAVNQWDGYSYTYFEPNNFRFYHDPTTGKFTFIPWGHDLSMKAFQYVEDDRPARQYIPVFMRPLYENRSGARDSGGRIFVGDRVGSRAQGGCLDSAPCRSEYAAAVREVIAVYESVDLPALAEATYALIRPHVYEESSARREISTEQFEGAYETLLQFIAGRTQAMRDDLAAAGFAP